MIIEVEQHHIDQAIRKDPDFCPIAVALIYEGYDHCSVVSDSDGAIVEFTDGRKWKLSKRCMQFMQKFDEFGPEAVKPFRFRAGREIS